MKEVTTIALATLAALSTSSSAPSSQPSQSSLSGPEIVTARNTYRDALQLYYARGLTAREGAVWLNVPEPRVPHLPYQALLRLQAAVLSRLRPKHSH